MRSVARVLAAGTTSLLLVGLVPASAFALDATIVSTTPAASSRVASVPTISVTFTQNATGSLNVTPPGTAGDFHCTPSSPTPPSTVISCTPGKTGPLVDGVYSVQVLATVATSPTPSNVNNTFTFTLDQTPPPAPTGLAISPSPYTKAASNAATPFTVSGTSESAGDSVAVTLTSSAAASPTYTKNVTAGTAGAFTTTFDPTTYPLGDGTITATARATDALGNVSSGPTGLASITATKDTVAPTAPTGVTIAPAPYAKADLDASRSLSVSGTAGAQGESVTVTLSSSGGGSPATATTTAIAGGAFGVSFAPFSVRLPVGYTTLVVTIPATPNNAAGSIRFRAFRT